MQFRNNNRQDNNEQPNPPPNFDWRRWIWPGLLLFFLVWTVLSSGSLMSGLSGSATTEVPYSTVRNEAMTGNVGEIVFAGDSARGQFRSPIRITMPDGRSAMIQRFSTDIPPDAAGELLQLLNENDPQAVVRSDPPQTSPLLLILLNFGPFLLIILFFIWMSRRAQGQMNGVFGFGRSQAREYSPDMPRITFDDVAGQDSAKRDLVEVVDFLKEPEKYITLGARIPRGVLLVGPPGTGKTLMARAVAGEANVPFYSIAASEFVEMFVGVGASRVRDLFNRAKENSPSIVFIDEIDAVGRQRGAGLGGGNDEREQTLNQMLAEMDGFDQSATVIVMAATNRPDVLDPALLRPGRFDRQVTVELPDRHGRLSILKIHTRGKPLAEGVDLTSIANATIGFSGADIANLANEAALTAARHGRKKIIQADFSYAFERIILGNERPPLSNQEERRIVAYHEAGHAVVSAFTPQADNVLKVTITPRGQALGITAFMPDDDRRNYSRTYIESQLCVALGGRIAEELIFHDVTTGAANDLQRATDLARRMVAQFGMTDAIGPLNFGEDDTQPFLGYSIGRGRRYSEETAARIDTETRRIIEDAYKRTTELLVKHRDELDALANKLLTTEVVERDEFLVLMGLSEDKVVDASQVVRSDQVAPPEQEKTPVNGSEVERAAPDTDEPKAEQKTDGTGSEAAKTSGKDSDEEVVPDSVSNEPPNQS